MNKTAAIYARVSTDRQKDHETIASQTTALLEYAPANQHAITPEWRLQDEGYSGSTLVRPGLERLREPARRATAPVHLRVLRWAIGPVALALALLAGWWGMQRPASRPEALAAATAAFELGNDVSRTVPGAVMDPLSDELDRVQRDLDNTAQLLLTAMP